MTNDQLFRLDWAIREIVQPTTASAEVLAWTFTYLAKEGDALVMRTVSIPVKEEQK